MTTKTIELKIDKLAGLGDGVGSHEGKKIFVPYTAAGDVVRINIFRETSDATYGMPEAIITASLDRQKPPCKHFATCGGCALQHLKEPVYLNFKQTMAQEAIRKAGYEISAEPMVSIAPSSRRRVELKAHKGKLGFFAERSNRIIEIDDCKIMEPELLELFLHIKKQMPALLDVTSIHINGVDGGYDLLIEGKGGENLKPHKSVKRISVREGGIKTIYQPKPVTFTIADVKVEIPPGAFLQASREAQSLMTKLVKKAVKGGSNVLDLFAGIGTYSFAIGGNITAVEGETSMVAAMKNAAQKNNLSTFEAVQRDLFHRPLTKDELSGYDVVIINPPRLGAKAQSEQLALSNVKKIVMVSCNPATFSRDARALKDGGFTLKKLTPIDQFVYSPHLELVAEFLKG